MRTGPMMRWQVRYIDSKRGPFMVLKKFIRLVCPLVLTLAAAPASVNGSGYGHRVWRVEDGLPQNRIRALSQTADGYLWIGTTEGLARFDGVRFTVFDRSNTPAMYDDGILSLRLSSDGALWIGTEGGGLVRYRALTWRRRKKRQGSCPAVHPTGFAWA